jgi:hypothetical protein
MPQSSRTCFNSHIVDVILVNDAFNFGFLCLKVMNGQWPTTWEQALDPFFVVRVVVGLVLIRFNVWAKVSSALATQNSSIGCLS